MIHTRAYYIIQELSHMTPEEIVVIAKRRTKEDLTLFRRLALKESSAAQNSYKALEDEILNVDLYTRNKNVDVKEQRKLFLQLKVQLDSASKRFHRLLKVVTALELALEIKPRIAYSKSNTIMT